MTKYGSYIKTVFLISSLIRSYIMKSAEIVAYDQHQEYLSQSGKRIHNH